jgi:hypothetical protein
MIVPRSGPLPLLSIHFSICYSLLILQLNTIQRDLPKASLSPRDVHRRFGERYLTLTCSSTETSVRYMASYSRRRHFPLSSLWELHIECLKLNETSWNLVVTNVSGEPHASILRVQDYIYPRAAPCWELRAVCPQLTCRLHASYIQDLWLWGGEGVRVSYAYRFPIIRAVSLLVQRWNGTDRNFGCCFLRM